MPAKEYRVLVNLDAANTLRFPKNGEQPLFESNAAIQQAKDGSFYHYYRGVFGSNQPLFTELPSPERLADIPWEWREATQRFIYDARPLPIEDQVSIVRLMVTLLSEQSQKQKTREAEADAADYLYWNFN